ncbi:uncharacterized protein LOC124679154 [Lolium rigidum]|uniref:uncharacterized protein LOC124679154 n=1 Tax=Lolium rigidum TaxID=89674 RepID=UPI001F5DCDCA|nr:uncharacterized protein LOC124679154 [Lolium rigidum]
MGYFNFHFLLPNVLPHKKLHFSLFQSEALYSLLSCKIELFEIIHGYLGEEEKEYLRTDVLLSDLRVRNFQLVERNLRHNNTIVYRIRSNSQCDGRIHNCVVIRKYDSASSVSLCYCRVCGAGEYWRSMGDGSSKCGGLGSRRPECDPAAVYRCFFCSNGACLAFSQKKKVLVWLGPYFICRPQL